MEQLKYKNALYLVKCGKCKKNVYATAQVHSRGSDVPSIVWHVNYCECGVKLVEKTAYRKQALKGDEAFFTIVDAVVKKKKKSRTGKEVKPILFDKKDDSIFSLAPNYEKP